MAEGSLAGAVLVRVVRGRVVVVVVLGVGVGAVVGGMMVDCSKEDFKGVTGVSSSQEAR